MAETISQRAMRRIHDKSVERARAIAELIVQEIAMSPLTPDGNEHDNHDGPHVPLRYSYYVKTDPVNGDSIIASTARYWAFVEYGTRGDVHGRAQPHVIPAVLAVKAEIQ